VIVSTIPQKQNQNIKFKGPMDGVITTSLAFLDTNPMADATLTDLGSMVIPRTYIDTKKRNKYAGAETFFRELTGTGIVCLSAGALAKGIAYVANKTIDSETKINPNSWVTNDGINVMKNVWADSENSTEKFVSGMFKNISGKDGSHNATWDKIDWNNIEWVDEKKWDKIKWNSKKFEGIHNKLKSEKSIINTMVELIEDKSIDKSDAKHIKDILESRITNAIKVNRSIDVAHTLSKTKYATSVPNLLRDVFDVGRHVFNNKDINVEKALNKLVKINKVKTLGALGVASVLGLTNQYINRKITEKRTGVKGFVGDVNYQDSVKKKETKKDNSLKFNIEKGIATVGIAALALGVMRISSPKQFIKKLEFAGPVTSGNAIKTVYTATLMGRFLASDNEDELRESSFRDYFGFLNWLVLGGFASKGVANIIDRKKSNLFNVDKEGKGVKHWFNDLSLKSHKEILAHGEKFAKANIWKVNLHQAAGLAYKTAMLGVVLPMLNIIFTNRKDKKKKALAINNQVKAPVIQNNKPNRSLVFKSFYHK